ncbi:RNA recognition motif domain [Trinorchestia longiramus]|nr:RNA recognition motif domain [Trinorchestia longiramus]
MHIDDVDALREWLTNFLAPLCDADPSALARYCIALVRKDKPTSELKEDMLHQLEVFLLQNTSTFVEKFLVVVDKKTYLPKKTTSDVKGSSDVDSSPSTQSKPEIKSYILPAVAPLPSSLPPLPPKNIIEGSISQLKNDSNGIIEAAAKTTSSTSAVLDVVLEMPLSDGAVGAQGSQVFKKEEVKTRKEDRENNSWRARSRDRRRSRSRNVASSRAAKHDDRPRRRYRRSWSRSRSPSPRRSRSPRHTRYCRTSPSRAPRIRSPGRRSRSPRRSSSPKLRSRSPNHIPRSPLLKTHSPPVQRSRSRSPIGLLQTRSPVIGRRSRSPLPNRRSRSPLLGRRSRSPLSGRRSRSPTKGSKGALLVLPDSPPGGQSPVLADTADAEDMPLDTSDSPHTKLSSGRRKKHRCKDYDEKGYCMRGDQCPYDHGADPVVLDFTPSTPYTASLPPDTAAPPSQGAGTVGANIAVPPPPHLAGRLALPPTAPSSDPLNEYTPSDPILWGSAPASGAPNTSLPPPHFYGKPLRGGGMMMGPPPPLSHSSFPPINHPPPSLPIHIPPPPFGGHSLGARELISVSTGDHAHLNKGVIRSSLAQRLGPPSGRGPSSRHNCSIELRKIPRGINTITHLNSHFQKFGKIVNMQVQYEGDAEAAVITFSKHSEANAAYRSTEAVLNNRFIKVFWHGGPAGKAAPSSTPPSALGQNGAAARQFTKVTSCLRPPTAPADAHSGTMMTGPALGSTAETGSVTALPDSSTATESSAPAKPVPHKPTAQEIKQQQIELILQQQKQLGEEVAKRQAEEKKKAEASKLKSEVRERTQLLLDKQMQELKLLLTKMEKSRVSSSKAEQLELLGAIKTLQSSIEATKKQLKASFPALKPAPAGNTRMKPKSTTVLPVSSATAAVSAAGAKPTTTPAVPGVEDAARVVAKGTTELTKKILDTEMDVYAVAATEAKDNGSKVGGAAAPAKAAPSSAEELAQLKTKLAQLKAEALQLSSKRGRGQPMAGRGGRGSAVIGRGRAGAPMQAALAPAVFPLPSEKHSCKLHASGFEPEDKDAVLTHFASLGTVISFLWDGQTPSVTVEYSTRRHAEKAIAEGRMLGDRLLTITWVSEHRASALPPVPSTQKYLDVQYDPASQHDEDDDDDDGNIFERKGPPVIHASKHGQKSQHSKEEKGKNNAVVKKGEIEKKERPVISTTVADTSTSTATATATATSKSTEGIKSGKEQSTRIQRLPSESSLVLHDELLHEGDDEIIDCDDEEDEHDDSSWKR